MAKRTKGRPLAHADAELAAVIERMGEHGVSLKEAAAALKIPYKGLHWRIANDERLSRLHARAREVFADAQVQEMNAIARDEKDIQRARLLCDNIKWYAARVLPKQYGDRQQLEHTGANGQPLPALSDRDFGRRVAFHLAKAVRGKEQPSDAC